MRFFYAPSKTRILASHSRIFWERNEQGMEVFVLLDRSSLRPIACNSRFWNGAIVSSKSFRC